MEIPKSGRIPSTATPSVTPGMPIETKSRPTTPLGARLQGMGDAADGVRRLVVEPPSDEPDPRLQVRQVSAGAPPDLAAPPLPATSPSETPGSAPTQEDPTMVAAYTTWSFGTRREDLPARVQLALQQPNTLYAIFDGIQAGLALPSADSHESLGHRIARLAEASMAQLIQQLLDEELPDTQPMPPAELDLDWEPTAPAGLPSDTAAAAAEPEQALRRAVDDALAYALDHGGLDGAVRARLLDPSARQRLLAEASQDFSPMPGCRLEELEALAFLAAQGAIERVVERGDLPGSTPTTGAETKAGPRRLNVDEPAEVRDPRIVHLADSAALSDDDDLDTPMPPPKVNGVSPDTGFEVAHPARDALITAMIFNGASVGLGQAGCMSLLRGPGILDGLERTLTRALRDQGFTHIGEVTDAAMRRAADDATAALLRARGFPVDQAADRKG